MLLSPQNLSVKAPGGIVVPAGAIIGFDGLVSAIPVDWDLCDGTLGTPDLRDKFIRGADEITINRGDNGGSTTGQVSGTTSSEGAHTGSGGGGGGSGGIIGYPNLVAGAHSHSLTGDLSPWQPPAREVVYIKSSTVTTLPIDAVLWVFDSSVPSKMMALSDLEERFLLGVSADSRSVVGSDTRDANMDVVTDGVHTHNVGTLYTGSGSTQHSNSGLGGHVHSSFVESSLAVSKPPYVGLMGVIVSSETLVPPKIVLAYDDTIGSIPAGWVLCDGTSGTPDMVGNFPIGTKPAGIALNDTGGTATPDAISGGTTPSAVNNHNHDSGAPSLGSSGAHASQDNTHSHASWTGQNDTLPPWYGLYFIMST